MEASVAASTRPRVSLVERAAQHDHVGLREQRRLARSVRCAAAALSGRRVRPSTRMPSAAATSASARADGAHADDAAHAAGQLGARVGQRPRCGPAVAAQPRIDGRQVAPQLQHRSDDSIPRPRSCWSRAGSPPGCRVPWPPAPGSGPAPRRVAPPRAAAAHGRTGPAGSLVRTISPSASRTSRASVAGDASGATTMSHCACQRRPQLRMNRVGQQDPRLVHGTALPYAPG